MTADQLTYEYRWLNPANLNDAQPHELAWRPVVPREAQTFEGRPCVEVRPVRSTAEGDAEALALAAWIEGEACGGSNWNAKAKRTAEVLRALASKAQPKGSDKANEWRKLAQQFDGQRMAAMVHLRTLLAMPQAHAEAARAFLAATPAEQIASVAPVQAPAPAPDVLGALAEQVQELIAKPSDILAPEYAAALREMAAHYDMSEMNVLRAAVRLYQAQRHGSIEIVHKRESMLMEAPVQAPAVEAEDDMLEPLIYAAIMHNSTPKTAAEFERAARTVAEMLERRTPASGEWRGLTDEERAAFVNEICDHGTGFVAPLFSLAESLEDVLRARNSASPAAPAQAEADAKDATRYQALRGTLGVNSFTYAPRITDPSNEWLTYTPDGLDKVCDEMAAALAAKKPASRPPVQGSQS